MSTARPTFRLAALAALLAFAGCSGSEDLSHSTVPPGESPTEKLSKAPPPPPVIGGGGGTPAAGGVGLPR